MKKILLLLVASVFVFSCTKDVTVADATADLSSTLTQYDDTNLGAYIGVFTTVGTMERGVLKINITPENYPVATIELVSGQEVNFKASQMINDGDTISNLEFRSASTSVNGQTAFKMSVDMDGTNVQISEVVFNGTASGMIAMHETSRAPVTPITGVLACDDCDAHPLLVTGDTGTFSMLFAGDGSGDDTVMSMADVGAVVGMPGTQSGCADNGDGTTSCAVDGAGSVGSNVISYTGTHLYTQVLDCSMATGTWALDSGNHGAYTGTFTSDTVCTPPPPANDLCADAIDIACDETMTGSTATATDEDGAGGAEVWYRVVGTTSGDTITASLCDGGTDYDSRLNVYDMCGGTILAGNDDFCGLQSEVSWTSDGSDVMVAVDAFSSGTGNYSLAITCETPAGSIPGCDSASSIALGVAEIGDTTGGPINGLAICGTSSSAGEAWYTYTAAADGDLLASLCDGGTGFDSKLTVWTGTCVPGGLTCVGGNDDACGLQSEVTFTATTGVTYLIMVHGFSANEGAFSLVLDTAPAPFSGVNVEKASPTKGK